MIVSLCYIVVVLITFYVCYTSLHIIRTTSSLVLAVPLFAMYFWSIYGAWSLIPIKLDGGSIWYEDMAYTINIDVNYLYSLILYSIFILIFGTIVKRIAKIYSCSEEKQRQRREIFRDYIDTLSRSKSYYFIIYTLFFLFLYYSMKNVSVALAQGLSGYNLSRFDSSLGSGFNSMVSFFGDTSLYLSVPLLFSRIKKKKIRIIIPILVYFFINLLLGNRATLLGGLVLAILFFTELNGLKQAVRPKYLLIGIVGLTAIQAISFVRVLSVNDILSGNFKINFLEVLGSTTESNEKYAAHMSMYGVLSKDVSPNWGTSVLFLISSIVPKIVGFPRPDEIYIYYITQTIHSNPGFGLTIHHATAWYLNFGLLGIIAGALLWGYVFKYLYSRRSKYIFFYGLVLFSAISIQMIRGGGLETYKGGLLLATILPMLIVKFCQKKVRLFRTSQSMKYQ